MTDKAIGKLLSKLTQSLATKKDLDSLATKKDLDSMATKKDLDSLATKKDLDSMATKDDIIRLERMIDELDKKADIIMEFADEVDKTTSDHEKRLRRIETIPVIAHQIKS